MCRGKTSCDFQKQIGQMVQNNWAGRRCRRLLLMVPDSGHWLQCQLWQWLTLVVFWVGLQINLNELLV